MNLFTTEIFFWHYPMKMCEQEFTKKPFQCPKLPLLFEVGLRYGTGTSHEGSEEDKNTDGNYVY